MRRHLPLSLPAFFLSIFLLVAGLIPVTSARADDAAAADPQTVSADALPTAQINGVVWDQAVVGNTVYVAGSFTSARPAGSAAGENEQSRSNLMAYDLTTGDLLSWAPSANGDVNSIEASADGSTLYVGGSFTQLNGANAYRVGAISAADGSSRSLGLKTNATVKAVALSADGSTPISGAQVLDAVPTSGKDGNWTSGATVSVLVPSAQGSSAAALGASGNAAVVVTAAGQPIGDH